MFSIYDNLTGGRLSIASYRTVEEANRDYHMNEGHTHVGNIATKRAERAGRHAAQETTPQPTGEDVDRITEYGMTQRLSRPVRVF